MRSLRALAMTAICALALGACQQASTPTISQEPAPAAVTLGLSYIPNVQFAPVYVADAQGQYRNRGLNVTLRHHGSDEGVFTALTTGEEQVVLATGDEVLQARAHGMDIVSVGAYYQHQPSVLLVREDSPIRAVADLRGKKVGIPGEYGSSWLALQALLAQASMTTSDIHVMSIGYTQTTALSQGSVDAVMGMSNNEAVQLAQAGIPVRAVDCECTLPLVSAVLVTTRSWADAHVHELESLIAATEEGIRATVASPEQAVSATEQWDTTLSNEVTRTSALAIATATNALYTRSDGTVTMRQDLNEWKRMSDFLSALPGVLPSPVDVNTAVSNSYVSRS